MKIKLLILMLLSIITIEAQSILIVGSEAILNISATADICSDSLSGNITGDGSFCGNPTAVKSELMENIPTIFSLEQNYPNPFNPSTKISWQSPVNLYQTLKVYDMLGNEVATLINEEKPAGIYEIDFNASQLSSGVYLYKLQAGEFKSTKKMILMK
ncbi:MAG: T9SS type A sorting domain-containing protein [Ignavibacteriales bacterium]|nr:T9SS type A sorting domain-containing protein [Ignavibacteriales bacterium]